MKLSTVAYRSACAVLLSFTALTPSIYAQVAEETFVTASANSSFEDGLNSWTFQELQATVIQRDYGTPDPFFETTANTTAVRLNGRGGFGQFITLNPSIRHQLLRAYAYTQPQDASAGAAGRAGVVVSYYDQQWNEVEKYEYAIRPRSTIVGPRVTFPGDSYETFGTYIPNDAAFAFLFVWIYDDNTEVTVDDLELLDVVRPTGPNANLVLNSELVNIPYRDENHPYTSLVYSSRREFWSHSPAELLKAFNSGFTLGSPEASEAIWQFVDMEAGKSYQLSFSVGGGFVTPVPPAGSAIGIDFLDGNYQLLSKQIVPMIPTTSSNASPPAAEAVINTPSDSVHEVFWVYVPPTATGRVQPGRVILTEQQ